MLRVARTLHLDLRGGVLDLAQILGAQLHARRTQILFEALQLGRAGNRHDPRLLRQQPGQRDLGRRRALALRDSAQQLDQSLVRLARLGRKAGQAVAEVVLAELRVLIDGAGEKASAERTVWYEANAQLLADGQHLPLRFAPPQRILTLQRRHRLYRVRTTDGLHTGFRKTEILDLARSDQILDRAGDVFDRHLVIDAMLVEEIDGLDLEPLERSLRDLFDVLRPAVEAALRASLRIEIEAELGGDHHLPAERRERLAHQLLVRVGAVNFGGVEERHAALHRRTDQRNALLLVHRQAVGEAQAHAAQPECRNLRAVPAQFALLHVRVLRSSTNAGDVPAMRTVRLAIAKKNRDDLQEPLRTAQQWTPPNSPPWSRSPASPTTAASPALRLNWA